MLTTARAKALRDASLRLVPLEGSANKTVAVLLTCIPSLYRPERRAEYEIIVEQGSCQ